MNYKDFLKDKKIAVIGLGPHGEMIADIKFLLRNKAKLSLYDIRSEKRSKGFLSELTVVGLEKFSFGKINPDDLLDAQLIIISPEISKKSFFLKKAIEAGIQIEYPETLFFKLAPSVTLIGVMGLYGKSTVAHLIYSTLKRSFAQYKDQGLFFIDPDSTNGALTHLKKLKKGDVVLIRITDQLLPYYHEIHICPHVAVLTSPINFDILKYQTYNNFIVGPDSVIDALKAYEGFSSKAKILRTRASSVPADWNLTKKTVHDLENAAIALQVSELFKVPVDMAREVMQGFLGLKGRMEFIKKVGAIEFYNDACSVTPYSIVSALKSVSTNKNVVLITGGAYTSHDYEEFIKCVPEYTSSIILLPGSGTIGLRASLENVKDISFVQVFSLEEAVQKAREISKKGDIVLFSPGFEAVGVDASRKERGEKFVKAVRAL